MILKNYQLENANFLNSKFYLFYGDNEGLKDEQIDKIHQSTKYKKFLYYEKDILNDTESFFDAIYSKSFFENEKIIIIKNVTDKIKDILENIINKNFDEIIIILNADKLEKKSKIRSLFEKEKNLICVPFYPDDHKNLNVLAHKIFKNENIKISQESINLIIERSNGSRQHLKNEIEKIKGYSIDKKEIDISAIIKLTNLGKNYEISELVEYCLTKNQKKISKIINDCHFTNEDTILIIRTFLLKAKRLLDLSNNCRFEKNIEKILTSYKPPIFWKEKEAVKQQLNIWSNSSIKKLIKEINETEYLIKKNINLASHILFNFIFKNSKIINN